MSLDGLLMTGLGWLSKTCFIFNFIPVKFPKELGQNRRNVLLLRYQLFQIFFLDCISVIQGNVLQVSVKMFHSHDVLAKS